MKKIQIVHQIQQMKLLKNLKVSQDNPEKDKPPQPLSNDVSGRSLRDILKEKIILLDKVRGKRKEGHQGVIGLFSYKIQLNEMYEDLII